MQAFINKCATVWSESVSLIRLKNHYSPYLFVVFVCVGSLQIWVGKLKSECIRENVGYVRCCDWSTILIIHL